VLTMIPRRTAKRTINLFIIVAALLMLKCYFAAGSLKR
jgi:hypothetical protein